MHKRYSTYKDSGIEWVGLIPNDWDIAPIRALCYRGRGRVISNEEIANNSGDYPVYSSQTTENGIMGCLNTYDFDGEYVTWTTDGANAGTVFHRQGKFNCTNVCGTLKAKAGKVFPRYLPYVLNLGTKCYVRYDINPKLMNNEMAGIRIPLPRFDEQENISNYLDRKTTQIDDLIAKKEQMIELLKEERTAIINQAVTKGIDPKVEMKDSGIEWLGKIPKHWMTKKIKHLTMNHDAARIPLSSEERGLRQGSYPYYGANGIIDCIDDYLFDGEYILVGEDGAPFFIKDSDVSFLVKGRFWVNNHAHILSVAKGHDPRYLAYTLNSVDYREYITGSTRDKLTQDDLSRMVLPVGPYLEQKTIADYLDRKTAQIDTQVVWERKSIEYLKEFRTALISEVVTGKIDVSTTLNTSVRG